MVQRATMTHEVAGDVPPRMERLVMRALALASAGVALGGSALALCLAHHG